LDIKEELATEALRIVNGSRRSAYGTPERNFERIALLWGTYLTLRTNGTHDDPTNNGVWIEPRDVAAMMRLMKEARLIETPDHRDSYLDIVGYALCGAEVSGVRSILDELDARIAELDAEEATGSDTHAAHYWTDPEHEDGA
jgi:hypothetical protein